MATDELLEAQRQYLRDIRDLLIVLRDLTIEGNNKLEKLTRSS